MITFKQSGSFTYTDKFLNGAQKLNFQRIVETYAHKGVLELEMATPKDTGVTANSWDYEITSEKGGFTITWTNSSTDEGVPIVILLQYGHGTRGGTFVQGRDFINPAIKPIVDKIAENLWAEVSKL